MHTHFYIYISSCSSSLRIWIYSNIFINIFSYILQYLKKKMWSGFRNRVKYIKRVFLHIISSQKSLTRIFIFQVAIIIKIDITGNERLQWYVDFRVKSFSKIRRFFLHIIQRKNTLVVLPGFTSDVKILDTSKKKK